MGKVPRERGTPNTSSVFSFSLFLFSFSFLLSFLVFSSLFSSFPLFVSFLFPFLFLASRYFSFLCFDYLLKISFNGHSSTWMQHIANVWFINPLKKPKMKKGKMIEKMTSIVVTPLFWFFFSCFFFLYSFLLFPFFYFLIIFFVIAFCFCFVNLPQSSVDQIIHFQRKQVSLQSFFLWNIFFT